MRCYGSEVSIALAHPPLKRRESRRDLCRLCLLKFPFLMSGLHGTRCDFIDRLCKRARVHLRRLWRRGLHLFKHGGRGVESLLMLTIVHVGERITHPTARSDWRILIAGD